MQKHTPIPWEPHFRRDEEGNIHEAWVSIAEDHATIAAIECNNVQIDAEDEYNARVEADTRLIAAAPDLLAVCKDVVACFSTDGEYNSRTAPIGLGDLRRLASEAVERATESEPTEQGFRHEEEPARHYPGD